MRLITLYKQRGYTVKQPCSRHAQTFAYSSGHSSKQEGAREDNGRGAREGTQEEPAVVRCGKTGMKRAWGEAWDAPAV